MRPFFSARILLLALAPGALGCELIAHADRSLIPGGGGAGGMGGEASTGATTSTTSAPIPCVLPADCPGSDTACTVRSCDQGTCGTAFVAKDTPTGNQIAGDCKRETCDGTGHATLVNDDTDVPVDGNPCTTDTCTAGVPSNPPADASTPCDTNGGKFCDGNGQCVECVVEMQCPSGLTCVNNQCVTCGDSMKDGTETDVDCGGSVCLPCADGKKCLVGGDCKSGVCTSKTCQAPSCTDHVANGVETDVDCGGAMCPPCGSGKHCASGADCKGGVCTGGSCQPTCNDGEKDNAETDVDCGGGTCPKCGTAKSCSVGSDCASTICVGGSCAPASCGDHLENGDESDVDCGGSCQPCGPGRACGGAADCTSLVCAASVCQAPTCTDHVKNGMEAGVDCGAASGCGLCANGLGCGADGDCGSGICADAVCTAPSCTDHRQNEGESDVDCGGGVCAPCAFGKHCNQGSDCASTVCLSGMCTMPACNDNLKNGSETDVDCGGPTCARCPDGGACNVGTDCQSFSCSGHVCLAATCSDNIHNGAETDVDCGGPTCPKCGAGAACVTSADCASPTTCGGGGMAGVCGCTAQPLAMTCAGHDCGTVNDNCGQPTDCGSCGAPYTCGGGGTANVCGCANPAGCHLTTLAAKSFGGQNDNDGFAVAVTGSNVLLAGSFVSDVDFGGGKLLSASNTNDDAYLAKLDLSGGYVWANRYGDAAKPQFAFAVAADPSGNVLTTGTFGSTIDFGGGVMNTNGSSDLFVAKLDPTGNQIWAKHYGDASSQTGKGITSDATGNVYVTGAYQGTMDLGGGALPTSNGKGNLFVAKLDPSGNYVWAKGLGDPVNPQIAYGVASDAAGNVAITGTVQGSIDFGGGTMNATVASTDDVFVAAYTTTGTLRWAKIFGDSAEQQGNAVAVDSSGNIVVVGFFAGTIDFGGGPMTATGTNDAFIAKFDPTGNLLWAKHAGGSGSDTEANGVGINSFGEIFVTGSFTGTMDCGAGAMTSAGATDVLVMQYAANGTCLASKRYGDASTGAQTGRGVATDAAGNAYIVGDYDGSLDVDIGPLATIDLLDIFLIKVSR